MRGWKSFVPWLTAIVILMLAIPIFRNYVKHRVEEKTFRLSPENTEHTNLALREGIQRITIPAGDHEIFAHWSEIDGQAPSLFILEGNGENISDWAEAQLLLRKMGYNTFIFDYAGFGSSTGKPTVNTLEQDAILAWKKFCSISHPERPRIAIGHSLGAAVLLSSVKAYDPLPDRLVLHAPFSSARDIAVHLGTASPYLARIIPDIWNNKSNIQKMTIPTCILHSKADEKTPWQMSRAIASHNHSATLIVLDNYQHNDLFNQPDSTLWKQIIQCGQTE
jgi:uncharacterized protein